MAERIFDRVVVFLFASLLFAFAAAVVMLPFAAVWVLYSLGVWLNG